MYAVIRSEVGDSESVQGARVLYGGRGVVVACGVPRNKTRCPSGDMVSNIEYNKCGM